MEDKKRKSNPQNTTAYIKNNLDRIELRVTKESKLKSAYQEHCEKYGYINEGGNMKGKTNLNMFFTTAADVQMLLDKNGITLEDIKEKFGIQ